MEINFNINSHLVCVQLSHNFKIYFWNWHQNNIHTLTLVDVILKPLLIYMYTWVIFFLAILFVDETGSLSIDSCGEITNCIPVVSFNMFISLWISCEFVVRSIGLIWNQILARICLRLCCLLPSSIRKHELLPFFCDESTWSLLS